jgi:hypothetical protein
MTVMWSAAVFDPALPGRSITANGSPILSSTTTSEPASRN